MAEKQDSMERVAAAAEAAGIKIDIQEMPASTRTAAEAAAACKCTVAQIVKSLVFRGAQSGTPYLLLVSGKNRVDEAGIARHLGEAVERPDAAYVRTVTGYAIGGIPPIGHSTSLATYIDEDLLKHQVVYAAAGTPHAIFASSPADLRDAARAKTIRIAK